MALVEQARTLTPEDATRLDAAWDAARYAARDAAWYAAWDAARAAAGYAVNALVVRDLITTEQFDILYGPWKAVMETPR